VGVPSFHSFSLPLTPFHSFKKRGSATRNLFFSFKSHLGLFLGAFFDSEFTSVVAALGAYMVIHDLCAAIAASRQLGALQRIVRSSLGRSGLRESVFWMWHIITFLII